MHSGYNSPSQRYLQVITGLSEQKSRMAWLAEHIPKLGRTGIVYTLTKRATGEVARWLRHRGIFAYEYNSTVVGGFRSNYQYCKHLVSCLMDSNNSVEVLIATKALRGIDCAPGVDYIIHYQAPGSVRGYYEQVEGANCRKAVLLPGVEDGSIIKYFNRNDSSPNWEAEWRGIKNYIHTQQCRIAFLQRVCEGRYVRNCGCCDNCSQRPLINPNVSPNLVLEAQGFLQKSEFSVKLPVRIPDGALVEYPFRGNLPILLHASDTRVLSRWADAGWGSVVKKGKEENLYLGDDLVNAVSEMIIKRWSPSPFPRWLTCIPSARNRALVHSFSERLARKLGLPFREALIATGRSEPQKDQVGDYSQCKNLDGAFNIKREWISSAPLFLIDDIVDSGWTFAIASALLRQFGSGGVYPVALSSTATGA